MNESEIFLAAAQIEDPKIRAAFIRSLCVSPEMEQRILTMFVDFAKWSGGVDGFASSLTDRVALISHDSDSPVTELMDTGLTRLTLSPGTQFASYEIVAPLGAGGMGEVYLARDPRLDRKVGLKILPPKYSQDPKWVMRFQREAKAASALNHPNILTIYEIGHVDERHFIATEFIDGQTLRAKMNGGKLTLNQKMDIAIQIANALHAAHESNLMHRDIKPENIMVREDGLVKILDFGIAKLVNPVNECTEFVPTKEQKTEPGLKIGTIRYMSPEQASGSHTDYRTDIFSFGIVLFELFSGHLPFNGNNDIEAISAILQRPPLSFMTLAPDLPKELDSIVTKMLEKDPSNRYASVKEVGNLLRSIGIRSSEIASSQTASQRHSAELKDAQKKSGSRARDKELRERTEGMQATKTEAPATDTQLEEPEVRYALSGNINIAYQVLGKGDFDIVFVMGWVSHLEWFWKEPSFARFLSRLASFARLILFDKRGTGLSDRVPYDELPTLEQRMDDVRAVMNAVGSDKAVLLGISEGGPMCSLFAATYPEKTIALAMIGSYARRLKDHDYPWGPTTEEHSIFLDDIRRNWGGPVGIQARAPSSADDPSFRTWWATYLRMGASPGAALALTKMNAQIDVRPILRSIQVPTIVIHRRGDRCLLFDEGKYLADSIPNATLIALPGDDHLPFVGDQEQILAPLEQFLKGVTHNRQIKRVLVTVLYAETAWDRNTIDEAQAGLSMSHAKRDVELFRGKAFATDYDSVVASFDGPARAIRAAIAIRNSSMRLGVELKIGIHTGECEISDDKIEGPGVETARKIAAMGNANAVLVSKTVKDLIAGSEIEFVPFELPQSSEEAAITRALFSVDG